MVIFRRRGSGRAVTARLGGKHPTAHPGVVDLLVQVSDPLVQAGGVEALGGESIPVVKLGDVTGERADPIGGDRERDAVMAFLGAGLRQAAFTRAGRCRSCRCAPRGFLLPGVR
ncbi:MAG TPA: hypothetical protein VHN16_03450 [Streptosporangiaceae bacterium]|nr:hypothetical protein [Streptosporangiaceae bacterium]